MSSLILRLAEKGLTNPPSFIPTNTMYETIMGSVAYGVSSDTSDNDVTGFCIPPKDMLFPHLRGEIPGFGRQIKRFEKYQHHHIKDAAAGKEYDLNNYSIVKFFQLCMDCNPEIIESLFTPVNCVLHCTKIGNMVREKRKLFLSKLAWHRFKGYAHSQLHEMSSKDPEPGSKRWLIRQKFGYDVKFAYHIVRLMDEAEQLLTLGDLDLQRASEKLKAIRRGEVAESDIRAEFAAKEHSLERMYEESKLPWGPPEDEIRTLLMNCLEEHYGDLSSAVVNPDAALLALRQIAEIVEQNRNVICSG
jgi:predicted nucleotidyltransferase